MGSYLTVENFGATERRNYNRLPLDTAEITYNFERVCHFGGMPLIAFLLFIFFCRLDLVYSLLIRQKVCSILLFHRGLVLLLLFQVLIFFFGSCLIALLCLFVLCLCPLLMLLFFREIAYFLTLSFVYLNKLYHSHKLTIDFYSINDYTMVVVNY